MIAIFPLIFKNASYDTIFQLYVSSTLYIIRCNEIIYDRQIRFISP